MIDYNVGIIPGACCYYSRWEGHRLCPTIYIEKPTLCKNALCIGICPCFHHTQHQQTLFKTPSSGFLLPRDPVCATFTLCYYTASLEPFTVVCFLLFLLLRLKDIIQFLVLFFFFFLLVHNFVVQSQTARSFTQSFILDLSTTPSSASLIYVSSAHKEEEFCIDKEYYLEPVLIDWASHLAFTGNIPFDWPWNSLK